MRQNIYLCGQGSAPDSAQELTVCGAIGSLAVFNEAVREEGGGRKKRVRGKGREVKGGNERNGRNQAPEKNVGHSPGRLQGISFTFT